MEFELCIDSVSEATVAGEKGFKRVELCSGLKVGGLTPSYGLIASCVDAGVAEVHVMIRPRPGDFIYSKDEILLMQKDILAAKSAGAKGIVFGVLNEHQMVDIQKNLVLCETAQTQNLEITFHRAYDLSIDWRKDLESLINIGFTRVLTSGGKESAIQGMNQIKQMKSVAGNQLQIMAGAGINSSNARKLATTGIAALHFTARKNMAAQNNLGFGSNHTIDYDKIDDIKRLFE